MKLNLRKKKQDAEIREQGGVTEADGSDLEIMPTTAADGIEITDDMDPAERRKLERKKKISEALRKREEEELAADDPKEDARKRYGGYIIRRRKLTKAAARVLRMKRLSLLMTGLALALGLIFLVAAAQERMGNFTINLNRTEMYREGIMLSDTADFNDPQARLRSAAVAHATNISGADLPDNLHDVDGSHNGKDYMAYTFYVKNGGKNDLDYYTSIILEKTAKGADEAIRVLLIDHEENHEVYAKRARNGEPEPDTVPFRSNKVCMLEKRTDFKVGDVHKYTVVVWLEGDDPECVDAIIGGMVRLRMDIDIADPMVDRHRSL